MPNAPAPIATPEASVAIGVIVRTTEWAIPHPMPVAQCTTLLVRRAADSGSSMSNLDASAAPTWAGAPASENVDAGPPNSQPMNESRAAGAAIPLVPQSIHGEGAHRASDHRAA